MTVSLQSLPVELVLLLFEVGQLEVGDAMALRLVCKELHSIIESRPFWPFIARRLQHHRPLPTLALHDQAALTNEELREACFKSHHTIQNMASPEPMYRNHRLLTMDSPSTIKMIHLLPGGRHCLILQREGRVSIWDFRAMTTAEWLGSEPRSDDASGQHWPQPGGKCLFSFDTHALVGCTKCVVSGSHDQILTIAADGLRWSDGVADPISTINILTLKFVSSDEVEVLEHFNADVLAGEVDGIDIANGLCVAISQREDLEQTDIILVVAEYRCGRSISVHTGLVCDLSPQYDVLLTPDGHLLLCGCTDSHLIIHAYWDVRTTLLGPGDTTRLAQTKVSPHSTIRFQHVWVAPTVCWRVTKHRWPAQNARERVAIISSLNPKYPQAIKHLGVTVHWMQVEELVRVLQAKPSITAPPAIPYSAHTIVCSPFRSLESGEVGRLQFGSYGRHVAWTEQNTEEEGGSWTYTLRIRPLLGPFSDEALHAPAPRLRLPLELGHLSRLEICDQFGIVAISLRSDNTVHIFDY